MAEGYLRTEELKGWNKKGNAINAQFTAFNKFLDSIEQDETKLPQLSLRLEKILPLFDSFQQIQGEIEVLEGRDESNLDILEEFQNFYFNITAKGIACALSIKC